MEVQGRPALAPRLNRVLARAWARRWAALAFATVVTVAALFVAAQPVRSPWWTYADADASYTASALNLLLGRDVTFVDHPGLPLTEAMALAFGIELLIEDGDLGSANRVAFVDRELLDLDRTRLTFRGFAILVYIAGAVVAFFAAARLFGHWTWGFACGLLWIAAPGLVAMSIQLRPDVLLALLCIVFGFLIARALERRSLWFFAAASALIGFTTMVKLHALALVPALVLAAAWRPPDERASADAPGAAWRWLREHGLLVIPIAVVVAGVVTLLNWERVPFTPTAAQVSVTVALLAVVALAVATAEIVARTRPPHTVRRVFSRFHAWLVVAFTGGLLVPVVLDVPDGMRALVYIVRNVRGENVQEGVDSFSTPLTVLDDLVGVPVVIVFAVALVAGVVGAIRRDPRPVVWTTAALFMGALAFARPPNVHYFAPTFVLSVLAMLWLFQRAPRERASLLVWPVVLYVMWPAWDGRDAPAAEQARLTSLVAPAKQYVESRLGPGEVALVPSYWPFADSRFFELVQIYVDHTPEYPYRYLPATAAVRPYAQVRALRPRFFIGREVVSLTAPQPMQLGDLGEFTVAKVPDQELVAEIQQGPGVTEGW